MTVPVSMKKHSSGEEDPGKSKPSEHQTREWRAVSAAGLNGQGAHEIFRFTDTGVPWCGAELPHHAKSLDATAEQHGIVRPCETILLTHMSARLSSPRIAHVLMMELYLCYRFAKADLCRYVYFV